MLNHRSSSLQQAKDEQDAAFDDMQTRWFEDANNVTKSFQYEELNHKMGPSLWLVQSPIAHHDCFLWNVLWSCIMIRRAMSQKQQQFDEMQKARVHQQAEYSSKAKQFGTAMRARHAQATLEAFS
jgi:hypothetical protein